MDGSSDNTIKILRLDEEALLPCKATSSAIGYDIYANERYTLLAKSYGLVSTGISLQMPDHIEAQIRPRSGLAVKHGITILNSPGTIDPDYRGEIKVALINHSTEDFVIEKGMRIAQMVFAQIAKVEIEEVTRLNKTARNNGGFGSTGIN